MEQPRQRSTRHKEARDMTIVTLLLVQTVPILDSGIDWTKLGEVLIISLALLVLARAFLVYVSNSGKSDEREDGLLKQLIDLATSYKTESAEARDAYKAEAAATRAVVQESNDTLRALTEATNVQTGEIRKVPIVIDLLRQDFKDYQVITADEIEGIRAEMVTFRSEIKTSIDDMLLKMGSTNANVAEAVKDHQVIIGKLDVIIQHLTPNPTPGKIIDATEEAPLEKTG
jgi:hypothetical protein